MRRILGATVLLLLSCNLFAADDTPYPGGQPTKEHEFLQRFVGEWECDNEAYTVPGEPPVLLQTTMKGEMIGGFWATIVVKTLPSGDPYHGQGTFGYDASEKKYIGTWVDSIAGRIWRYEGSVDGTRLVFDYEGPHPTDPEQKSVKARDTWDFKSEDLLVLTSYVHSADGEKTLTMTATCKRKKEVAHDECCSLHFNIANGLVAS